jgi:hypothetical protein
VGALEALKARKVRQNEKRLRVGDVWEDEGDLGRVNSSTGLPGRAKSPLVSGNQGIKQSLSRSQYSSIASEPWSKRLGDPLPRHRVLYRVAFSGNCCPYFSLPEEGPALRVLT